MAIGYRSPKEGRANRTACYTIWVRPSKKKRWYSPKDISGIPRYRATHEHIRALRRKYPNMVVYDLKNDLLK
jgi:hypothetical protein